jgi:hypothetical protein
MTGLPPAAAEAAAEAIEEERAAGQLKSRALAEVALEAAEPHILAHAAARLKAECADEMTAICTETVLEAVAAERERIRLRLTTCRACGSVHPAGGLDHPNRAPWVPYDPADPNVFAFLDELLGDGPVP